MLNFYHKLHKEGYSMSSIADRFNLDRKDISRRFKQNGFTIYKGRSVILEESLLKILYEKYDSGQSIESLGVLNNIDPRLISARFKRFGYKVHINKHKNLKNEGYFDVIDTEFKAYFLGFFMADGNNCNGVLKIKLHVRDKKILEIFSLNILGKNTVLYYEDTAILKFGSLKMSKRFTELGIVPRKSYHKTDIPKQIPDNLIRHFVRGYFDGDGCISYKKTKYCSFSIVSNSKTILESFSNVFAELGLKKLQVKQYQKNCASIEYCNRESAIEIMKYMYNDSEFYLTRKYKIFQKIYANTVLNTDVNKSVSA